MFLKRSYGPSQRGKRRLLAIVLLACTGMVGLTWNTFHLERSRRQVLAGVVQSSKEFQPLPGGRFIPFPEIVINEPTSVHLLKHSAEGAYAPRYAEDELVSIRVNDDLESAKLVIPLGSELFVSPDEFEFAKDSSARFVNGSIKYFRERWLHYDGRYFTDQKRLISNEVRSAHLKGIFAAWAQFADSRKFPYWLAHGSLLGWYFGGRIMAFDDDLDLQTNANMLYEIARYNMTFIDPQKRYLLDVNPNLVNELLKDEYGKDVLKKLSFRDHHFDASVARWVKDAPKPKSSPSPPPKPSTPQKPADTSP